MNAAMASADIVEIAQAKNPSSRYFNPLSGISIHFRKTKFRPKNHFPSRPRYSETVPTGHSQLQNAFLSRNAIARNVISRNIAAGCIAGTRPLTSKYFKFINPAIGSQPSTPAGGAEKVAAPDSILRTHRKNNPPSHTFSSRNAAW